MQSIPVTCLSRAQMLTWLFSLKDKLCRFLAGMNPDLGRRGPTRSIRHESESKALKIAGVVVNTRLKGKLEFSILEGNQRPTLNLSSLSNPIHWDCWCQDAKTWNSKAPDFQPLQPSTKRNSGPDCLLAVCSLTPRPDSSALSFDYDRCHGAIYETHTCRCCSCRDSINRLISSTPDFSVY